MAHDGRRRQGAHYAALLEADDGETASAMPGGGGGRRRRKGRHRRGTVAALLIALALIGAFVGGGAWFWLNQPVDATVNGTHMTFDHTTTVAGAYERSGFEAVAGDLVSVGGNVLEEGAGDAVSIVLNGCALPVERAATTLVREGDKLEFSDGADVTEPYDEEVRDTAPRLVLSGTGGSVAYVSQWGRTGRAHVRTGRTSGEVAETQVIEEGRDCVVTSAIPRPEGAAPMVALTFDDGPSAYTQRYLEILARYGARATFFELGSQLGANAGAGRAVIDAGCEIMSHTMRHRQLTGLAADELRAEVEDAATTLEETLGVRTTSIRPPYGSFDESCWLASGGSVSLVVLWTQDSNDWRGEGVEAIVQNSLAGVTNGSIILMHDGGGNRDDDLAALPQIIESLQASGYQLVTVSELLRACPEVPTDVADGYAPMPDDAAWPTEAAGAAA